MPSGLCLRNVHAMRVKSRLPSLQRFGRVRRTDTWRYQRNVPAVQFGLQSLTCAMATPAADVAVQRDQLRLARR